MVKRLPLVVNVRPEVLKAGLVPGKGTTHDEVYFVGQKLMKHWARSSS